MQEWLCSYCKVVVILVCRIMKRKYYREERIHIFPFLYTNELWMFKYFCGRVSTSSFIIPQMEFWFDSTKVHMNKFLTSWKNLDGPAPFHFFRFETHDFTVLATWEKDHLNCRSNPWNKTNCIESSLVFHLTMSREQITYSSITTNNIFFYSWLQIKHNGKAILHVWNRSK